VYDLLEEDVRIRRENLIFLLENLNSLLGVSLIKISVRNFLHLS